MVSGYMWLIYLNSDSFTRNQITSNSWEENIHNKQMQNRHTLWWNIWASDWVNSALQNNIKTNISKTYLRTIGSISANMSNIYLH